ncbi:hypothetical protein pipiens_020280, partial [Culex pipiens pipiens]
SYLGQIALSAVHDGHRHAAPYVDHLHRGPEPVSGSGARGNGRRRGWPGRQAQDHHRLPDAHDAGAAGDGRTGRARHRGVHLPHAHHGRVLHPAEKSQLRP